MSNEEVEQLPEFNNMYRLKKHFEERNYTIEFLTVNKISPNLAKYYKEIEKLQKRVLQKEFFNKEEELQEEIRKLEEGTIKKENER
jgi:hypothetical protein